MTRKFKTESLIHDVSHPEPEGGLLKEAQEFMYKHFKWSFPSDDPDLKDDQGRFAIRYKGGILVAKKKSMYDIVSVHRKACGVANTHGLRIYMYLKSTDGGAVYWIDPLTIYQNIIKGNIKGEAYMYNFSVKLLTRVKTDEKIKEKPAPRRASKFDRYLGNN